MQSLILMAVQAKCDIDGDTQAEYEKQHQTEVTHAAFVIHRGVKVRCHASSACHRSAKMSQRSAAQTSHMVVQMTVKNADQLNILIEPGKPDYQKFTTTIPQSSHPSGRKCVQSTRSALAIAKAVLSSPNLSLALSKRLCWRQFFEPNTRRYQPFSTGTWKQLGSLTVPPRCAPKDMTP